MSNDPIPTHQQMDTLRELVRDGHLTDEQRYQLSRLLDEIGWTVLTCARVAPQLWSDEQQNDWVAACWEPVGTVYAELLAAVAR